MIFSASKLKFLPTGSAAFRPASSAEKELADPLELILGTEQIK
jgi:hypothetical protein